MSRLRFFFFSSSVSSSSFEADPSVDAAAELVPVASVDWVAVPVADWSPVVVVALWSEAWSPVVVLAVVLTDWSPVVVALSIERLERPRKSTFGLTVEVEPVTEVSWLVVEPVIDESCEVEEPVADGLAVALPPAVRSVVDEAEADGELVAVEG